MDNQTLEKIKEETKDRVIKGKKILYSIVIINLFFTLISWLFKIYSLPFVFINLIITILIYYFSFTRFLYIINAVYRSYWYLAILFSMIDNGWDTILGLISIIILVFDIYSSLMMLLSKSIEEYLYERTSKNR